MSDDDGGRVTDELEAAVERLFADARRDAGTGGLVDPTTAGRSGIDVTDGELEDLDGALVAVRSASATAERQLIVRGGWVDVALDIVESGGLVDVRGSLFGVDEPCAVQLLDHVDEVALDVTDGLGEFALLGIPPGRYELVVAARRTELSATLDID
jgi:hypothetical protein